MDQHEESILEKLEEIFTPHIDTERRHFKDLKVAKASMIDAVDVAKAAARSSSDVEIMKRKSEIESALKKQKPPLLAPLKIDTDVILDSAPIIQVKPKVFNSRQ